MTHSGSLLQECPFKAKNMLLLDVDNAKTSNS